MNAEHYINNFEKPETMSDEEWYAIDFTDPLMWVC